MHAPLTHQFRNALRDPLSLSLLVLVSGHDDRRAVWQGWPELFFEAGRDIVVSDQAIRGLQNLRRRAIILLDAVDLALGIHTAERENRGFGTGPAKLVDCLVGIADHH